MQQSTKHLLAPELQPTIGAFPIDDISDATLPALRAMFAPPPLADPAPFAVTREEINIPSATGHVRCLLYRPATTKANQKPYPAYLHLHGGGYILGAPEDSDAHNLQLCSQLGIAVLSVDYRLAPEHPAPAALDDCAAALAYLHQEADRLNLDATRIAVGGESAGGGLAAALAIRTRDAGDPPICHQHLTYPMLDNRTGSDQHPGDPLTGEFVWTRQRNQYAWSRYLRNAPATAPQVPARVKSYADLPPAWIFTAQLDLFRDENLTYAQNLMAAAVPVDLQTYATACHGFFQIPQKTPLTTRYLTDHAAALARGLGVEG
ncbi:MAG: alpha/beta hydrolase fold domain-containing protein [Cellvibrionales bacterium]|nr:alpha/beta hydrolase fold domain-containing protein [Cellvibrionales bacterium]